MGTTKPDVRVNKDRWAVWPLNPSLCFMDLTWDRLQKSQVWEVEETQLLLGLYWTLSPIY